jgi:LysR family transcriptional regulator (chromosome initiation inhibitor)
MSLLSPQLVAFMMVVKNKTVHAAAEVLHITQTAVTQRIKALEARLKTTLFIRSRRGMELTSEGEALLRYCQAANALEGEALAQIQGLGVETEVTVTLCGPTSIMRSRIIPACAPMAETYPDLLFEFQIQDKEIRHQSLRVGDADFVVVQKQNLADEMASKALKPESYVLVCSSRWKHRKAKDIITNERIIDFEPNDQITLNYLQEHDLLSGIRGGRYFVNHTEFIADLVCRGLGYTALTREFVKPYIDAGDMIIINSSKTYSVQPYLAWYQRPEPPSYFQQIIKAIK